MKPLYDIGWIVGRMTGALLLGAQVDGRENIPDDGAFILAPNHISYLDPPIVAGFVPRRLHFFAKKELFDFPLFGSILRGLQVHPIRRGGFNRGALQLAIDLLKDGRPITVFPEGTRGKNGILLEPKAGIGRIAQDSGAPILPAFLAHLDNFKRCLRRKERLQIRFGELISASWIASQESNKEGWFTIAREVMRRIGDLRDTPAIEAGLAPRNESAPGGTTDDGGGLHMIRIVS
ncbi:MAG: 1-acyl-sn-glycerol-3-phosphate acyltransferase [candidate division Zixibacteria bacterium]|nr:1-acyl-sn-glycerol-3-phosphate acyltransferase [candidate division Zixibacteria bacterium]